MFYFDTSFLAPLVIEEDTSELIEIFMTKVPIEQCVTSQFTLVEFANIAARRVRMREYSQTEANEAILLFEQMINHGFSLITPSLEDFQQARLFLQNYQTRLRTGFCIKSVIPRL